MDFARKIGKSEATPRVWERPRIPFVTTKDNLISLSDDSSFPEDRRLVNWRRWLANRQRQSRLIESVTGRVHVNQLQNSSERFRALVETRSLMECAAASTPVTPDKYRGGPEFWKTPEHLPSHEHDCLPNISLTLTRRELNLPPDLTRVGLPDLMLKERNLAGLRIKEESWQRSKYLNTRKLELTEKISTLLPKEPELATLAVQGRAIRKTEPAKKLRVPVISITKADEEEHCEDSDNAIVLRIQDREFVWRKSLLSRESVNIPGPITWSLTFESEVDKRAEKEIVLENKGYHVIVYHWRDSSYRPTCAPLGKQGSPFFFNKTKGLVLPGQVVKIKVWYLSRVSGISVEHWRLVTEPKLSRSAFVFRFWGCAFDKRDAATSEHREIDEHLDRCVRDSAISSIVEEIVDSVERWESREPVREMLLLQRELFESANPGYFYRPSVVTQLKEIYRDVAGEEEGTPAWNLSLEVLRDTLLRSGERSRRRNALARFYDLCEICLEPSLRDISRSHKYNAVYNVLCAFANLFDEESEFANVSCYAKSIGGSRDTRARLEEECIDVNLRFRRKVFFIRIYRALKEAVERACTIIDSFNRPRWTKNGEM